jgi:hypothetical protein
MATRIEHALMPRCELAVSRAGLWVVDESHDLIEPRVVAIGGIDLYPGRLHRDPVERPAMAREIRRIAVGPWVGVHPAHRVVLAALQDPPQSHIVGDHAVDDTQIRKTAQWLEARPPDVVLERRLSDSRDPGAQQQLHGIKENGRCSHRQLIARRRNESAIGMGHAFLDLIPADGRAPHRPREPVRQRRLASADRATDNHQGRQGGHLIVIANATGLMTSSLFGVPGTSGHAATRVQRQVRRTLIRCLRASISRGGGCSDSCRDKPTGPGTFLKGMGEKPAQQAVWN